jgi:hypothetical protein
MSHRTQRSGIEVMYAPVAAAVAPYHERNKGKAATLS